EPSTIATVLGAAPPLPFIPAAHHGRPVLMAQLLFAGDADAERALAPFRALGPLADMVRPQRYPDLYGPEPEGPSVAAANTMFLDEVDEHVAGAILAHIRESRAQVAAVQLRVLGGAVARVPSEATAFAHRSRRMIATVAALDTGPGQEDWVRDVPSALRQGEPGAYVNFVGDEGGERVREAYPGKTWDRLAAIKREDDPENLVPPHPNSQPPRRRHSPHPSPASSPATHTQP